MLEEGIKKLLDSELEADNQLGWELIRAKNIPFGDVMDYVEQAKIATVWEKKYVWDGEKFAKNKNLFQFPPAGSLVTNVTNAIGSYTTAMNPWYNSSTYVGGGLKFDFKYDQIQEKEDLDKSSELRKHNKTMSKSFFGRFRNRKKSAGKVSDKA